MISATASPAPNAFGWNRTDVLVDFRCTDEPSGLSSCTGPVILSTEGQTQTVDGTAQDLAGRMASTTVTGISIDRTAPVVTYEGNESPYSLLGEVLIRCVAADALSGIAATTCEDVSRPAWSFEPGANAFTAEATDRAGNVGEGSTTVEVVPIFDDLCTLTQQFLETTNREPVLGRSLCQKLAAAERADSGGDLHRRGAILGAYLSELVATTLRFFTEEQAAVLRRWAEALATR
jgi:hypothetical protein